MSNDDVGKGLESLGCAIMAGLVALFFLAVLVAMVWSWLFG